MKKLLIVMSYIFCSTVIVPSHSSEQLKLEVEVRLSLLKLLEYQPEELKRRRLEELQRELATKRAYAEEEKKKAEERNQLIQQNSEVLSGCLNAVFAYVVEGNMSLDDLVKTLSCNRERFKVNEQILDGRHDVIAKINSINFIEATIVPLPASLPAQAVVPLPASLPAQHGQEQCSCALS
jgi:hypothetical protein